MKLRLTSRIILIFMLFAAVLLAVVGALSYRDGSESLKAAAISEMLAVAIEKEAALDIWFEERMGDLDELANAADLQKEIGDLTTAGGDSSEAKRARQRIVDELRSNIGGPRSGYLELYIIEPGGKVIASTDPQQEGKSKIGHPYFDNGKKEVYLQGPYFSADLHAPAMTAATPLRTDDGKLIGVLAARLDYSAMSGIIQRRTGLRQSDDAFLVNTDRRFVTQPRFISEPVVLVRKADTEAARRCVARNSGVILADDYRGVPSIVVYRWNAKRQLGLILKVDQAEALAPVRAFGRWVALISLLALLATGGLAFFLARTITGPLRALHENVRRFADGKIDAPLLETDGDEVGLLAAEFNTMAGKVFAKETQLRATARQLAEANETLRHEIEAHKQAEATAVAAREEADKANRAKSEFLSRVSHELRTPMNAILGFAQLLEMEDSLAPEARESVEQVLKGGRHLLELIDEVLDISRLEAGRMTLSLEAVPADELIAETLELVRPMAVPASVKLEIAGTPNAECHVLADRQRLKQVLLNLLSNAIKYNRAGGEVKIACVPCESAGQPALRICVTDTGPGIAPEKLPRLFAPFDRLDAERTHPHVEGIGLGLALSKRMVDLMGGVLGVESNPGQGSVFWVELPVAESPLARHEAMPSFHNPQSAIRNPKTLVYIEDNLSNLKLIERILAQRPGIKLLAAMQGQLGLDLIREHSPDLVLLDLNLPDISGQKVLAALRAAPETRALPVIIISADASPGQVERVLAAGAQAFLTKPLDVAEFLKVVEEALA
jgi:signal transduction histidine kinase/CheY-like chemotaxis protein